MKWLFSISVHQPSSPLPPKIKLASTVTFGAFFLRRLSMQIQMNMNLYSNFYIFLKKKGLDLGTLLGPVSPELCRVLGNFITLAKPGWSATPGLLCTV